ncbi:MAG TPA: PEP-CTERM sorting domain-containing protein [Candidatus Acidoferrales bacterium]|nr:PEP-CTERM sorting domain-containing protein [Candidatus Acidoferrales bacterium]
MRLRLVWFTVLALALLIPAGFAVASPASLPGDPSVIINKTASDATPFTGSFDVTLVDGGADIVFQNTLSVDITSLVIQFQVPLPTGTNTCASDIFSACGFQNVSFNEETGLLTENFVFGGGDITPGELFSFSADGFFGANPNATISSTPEPGTILLLLTGGIPLLGFGRKRWAANRAA